jgi:hypothetical protein
MAIMSNFLKNIVIRLYFCAYFSVPTYFETKPQKCRICLASVARYPEINYEKSTLGSNPTISSFKTSAVKINYATNTCLALCFLLRYICLSQLSHLHKCISLIGKRFHTMSL